MDSDFTLGAFRLFACPVPRPVVGEYALLKASASVCRNEQSGVEIMGIVLIMAGLIGLALLVYLFYVLFRGEEL